jgi:hypothetical protein
MLIRRASTVGATCLDSKSWNKMVHNRSRFDRFLLSPKGAESESKLRLAVITLLNQGTFIAFRILGTTNLPAMPDKVDVE